MIDFDKIPADKWHDEKWDVYSCVAESMAEEHSCEELLLTLSDVLSELNQYVVRKVSPTGGTLYKHGDTVDLFKYYTKTTILLMALHDAMKAHRDMFNIVEKSELKSCYDEYCVEHK